MHFPTKSTREHFYYSLLSLFFYALYLVYYYFPARYQLKVCENYCKNDGMREAASGHGLLVIYVCFFSSSFVLNKIHPPVELGGRIDGVYINN